MFISPIIFLFYFIISIGLYFVGIFYLSRKKSLYLGLILPTISLSIAIYNFIKPMIVYNPYPTMKEGMYMTFFGGLSIIGFIMFGIIRYVIMRNKNNEGEEV